jgi:hypothetical protein
LTTVYGRSSPKAWYKQGNYSQSSLIAFERPRVYAIAAFTRSIDYVRRTVASCGGWIKSVFV